MTKPKTQKKITFINDCGAIVNTELLEKAILWYQTEPTKSLKHIYLYGNYPAATIYNEKKHIHRLLVEFMRGEKLSNKEYVHHIDGNKLNMSADNLLVMSAFEHQSLHNAGKTITAEHRAKIAISNSRRSTKNRIHKEVQE